MFSLDFPLLLDHLGPSCLRASHDKFRFSSHYNLLSLGVVVAPGYFWPQCTAHPLNRGCLLQPCPYHCKQSSALQHGDCLGRHLPWPDQVAARLPKVRVLITLEVRSGISLLFYRLWAGFNLWVGRSPGEEKGYPLQYSGLEHPMGCPWGCRVRHHQVTCTLTFSLGLSLRNKWSWSNRTGGK